MPVKLSVKKTSERSEPDAYVFEEDVITIGRDGSNTLTLPDPNRVVSKQHAEIRCQEGGAQLVDLNSKNFTYLNKERLEPGRPRALQSGDLLEIGDFEVRYEYFLPGPVLDDRTVFIEGFVNPFEDDAQQLVEAFNRICQTFEQEHPARRGDALREAVEGFIVEPEPEEAKALLAQLLGVKADTATAGRMSPPEGPAPGAWPAAGWPAAGWPSTARPPAERAATERPSEPHRLPEARGYAEPRVAAVPDDAIRQGAGGARSEQLVRTLLDEVARLVSIPAQFRYEFIGQTIMHAPEEDFLHDPAPGALAKSLLGPQVTDEQFAERLELLRRTLSGVATHQVALLEGYKAAVNSGAQRLLDHLDPEQLVDEIGEGKALHRWMPGMAKQEAVDVIKERCQELRESDWSVAEQRFYRPDFIRAYLARQAASPGH